MHLSTLRGQSNRIMPCLRCSRCSDFMPRQRPLEAASHAITHRSAPRHFFATVAACRSRRAMGIERRRRQWRKSSSARSRAVEFSERRSTSGAPFWFRRAGVPRQSTRPAPRARRALLAIVAGTVLLCSLFSGIAVSIMGSTEAAAAAATTPWGPAQVIPTVSSVLEMTSVSCTDASDCTGVGENESGQPIAVTETDGVWAAPTNFTNQDPSDFSAVSCTAPGTCTAVGNEPVGSGTEPIVATETAGTWSAASYLSIGGTNNQLLSVSCTSAGNCAAVGESTGNILIEDQTNGAWDNPLVQAAGILTSVTCTGVTTCVAVGYIDAGASPSVYEDESSAGWSSPVALTGVPSNLSAISCTSTGNCTAIGYDNGGLHCR